jgi:hypothetical protein
MTISTRTLFLGMICFIDGLYSSIICFVILTSMASIVLIFVSNLQVPNVESNVP